jgi:hypothetical protein
MICHSPRAKVYLYPTCSAIKQHTLEHVREKPFITYKINNVPDDDVPLLELGYSVTKSEYRGNGINSALNAMLLTKIEGRKVYATTGVHSMKRYLKKRGFEIKGKPYDGKKSANIEYFEENRVVVFHNNFTCPHQGFAKLNCISEKILKGLYVICSKSETCSLSCFRGYGELCVP